MCSKKNATLQLRLLSNIVEDTCHKAQQMTSLNL